MNLCTYTSGKHLFATPGVAFVGGFEAESSRLMRLSRCASPFAAKFRCRNLNFGVVSSVILAVSYTRISSKKPSFTLSFRHELKGATRPHVPGRPTTPPEVASSVTACALVADPVHPCYSVFKRLREDRELFEMPLYLLWRDRHRFERKKLKSSRKILSIRFCGSNRRLATSKYSVILFLGQNPGSRISRKFTREGAAVSSAPLLGI